MSQPAELSAHELVAMSIQLGIDMTPDGNLETHLDTMIDNLAGCTVELDQLMKQLEAYACSVKGIDIAELKAKLQRIETTDAI